MSAVTVQEAAVLARDARAALARAALARAEERTGTGQWVRPVRLHPVREVDAPAVTRPAPEPGRDGPRDVPPAPAAPPAAPVPAAPAHAARPTDEREPEAAARLLPVAGPLAGLLPWGALSRGSTVVVAGSTSLTLGLLSEASRAGSWVALVGLPAVGVLAAHQLGLVLDRVVLVPSPGPDGPTVVAALLDGVDVVVVGPQVPLTDSDRRRLSARARERSAVLLPTTPWPGAQVVLTAQDSQWHGLGRGHGRLRSRRLTVRRGGRGTAAQGLLSQVTLPLAPHPWLDDEDRAPAAAADRPVQAGPGDVGAARRELPGGRRAG